MGACVHERSTKIVKGRQERDRERQRKAERTNQHTHTREGQRPTEKGRKNESIHTHTAVIATHTHARTHTLKNPKTDKTGCALLLPYRRGSLQLSDHRNVGIQLTPISFSQTLGLKVQQ